MHHVGQPRNHDAFDRRHSGNVRLVALSLMLVASAGCRRQSEYVPPPPPKVTVAHPVVEEVVVYGESPGRFDAAQSVQMLARVSGFIDEIAFIDGEFVEAGQVLFRIEPEQYQAKVDQAEASLAGATAALELAESRLQRMQRAAEQDAVGEIELIEARAQQNAAGAEVKAAEALLEAAQLDLSYTTVSAPFRGRVSESSVDLGEFVGAGGQTVLAEVTSLDPIYVYWNAAERGVLEFRAQGRTLPRSEDGQEIPEADRIYVKLRLADGSVYEHDGYVDYVSPRIDADTGTLRVRVRVDNPEYDLFPGQFARVMLARFEGEAVLVPEVSVQRDIVGPYLLALDAENIVVRRDVTLGELIEDRRIVLEGIAPEDRIVIVGVQRARPGLPVDPQMAAAPDDAVEDVPASGAAPPPDAGGAGEDA